MQKSFTDLLGPYQPDTDEVSGRFIARRSGTTTVTTANGIASTANYIVLWSFENDYKARAAFEFWKQESHA